MSTPSERFLIFYETSFALKKFKFSEYLNQEFVFKSPVKYQVKYSSSPEILLHSLCNAILKNLDSNPLFRPVAEQEFKELKFIRVYEAFYKAVEAAIFKVNCDENTLPKLILLLHLSKTDLPTYIFEKYFQRLDSLVIVNSDYDKISEYITELKKLYSKLIYSKNLRNFSIKAIRKINGLTSDIESMDISKIKLVFFNDQIFDLNCFSGIDSIYVSLNGLVFLHDRINDKLNKDSKMIIMKLNFVRLIQNEMTNILFRGFADDMNIPTTDILNKENKIFQGPGILSEIERFGGRIDWVQSSYYLNIRICEDYLQKIEADQDENFDLVAANVEFDTDCSDCFLALDMVLPTVMYE